MFKLNRFNLQPSEVKNNFEKNLSVRILECVKFSAKRVIAAAQ